MILFLGLVVVVDEAKKPALAQGLEWASCILRLGAEAAGGKPVLGQGLEVDLGISGLVVEVADGEKPFLGQGLEGGYCTWRGFCLAAWTS